MNSDQPRQQAFGARIIFEPTADAIFGADQYTTAQDRHNLQQSIEAAKFFVGCFENDRAVAEIEEAQGIHSRLRFHWEQAFEENILSTN